MPTGRSWLRCGLLVQERYISASAAGATESKWRRGMCVRFMSGKVSGIVL